MAKLVVVTMLIALAMGGCGSSNASSDGEQPMGVGGPTREEQAEAREAFLAGAEARLRDELMLGPDEDIPECRLVAEWVAHLGDVNYNPGNYPGMRYDPADPYNFWSACLIGAIDEVCVLNAIDRFEVECCLIGSFAEAQPNDGSFTVDRPPVTAEECGR